MNEKKEEVMKDKLTDLICVTVICCLIVCIIAIAWAMWKPTLIDARNLQAISKALNSQAGAQTTLARESESVKKDIEIMQKDIKLLQKGE